MFSLNALYEQANTAVLRQSIRLSEIVHGSGVAAILPHVPVSGRVSSLILSFARAVLAPTPDCSQDFVVNFMHGEHTIIAILIGGGTGITIIGIISGGLMRATAFGNERRIAMSNAAITSAVVGLVIVLLAAGAGNAIPAWFNNAIPDNCKYL